MIQIYNPNNTNFSQNGEMTLFSTKCDIHAILNGSWEMELEHPIDDEGRWKYIVEEAVVKAPSFNGDQLFRIKETEKSDSGVTATLEPIFMDAMNDCFLTDVRPTEKNGQQALDIMTAPNSKYSGVSNITTVSTAYYQYKNLIEAINGGDDNSFVNRWGGEILFDNFTICVNERIGSDRGVELLYGKNIPENGLSESIDIREVVTRIYPKAYNGYTMTNNGYVNSPLISQYPIIKAATITFDDVKMRADASDDDEANGVIICDTQSELDAALTQKCQEQYASGLDKPKISISADMVLLQNTVQYQDFSVLEEVSLGDTVHCMHYRLGIETDARVIELVYDCLSQKVSSVVLGDYEYNYFDNVTSSVNKIDNVVRPDGSLIAEQIKGFIDGTYSQLRAQKSIAQKQDVRAILFEDLDHDSPTFGALSVGTQGVQISKARNAQGTDWEWMTSMTFAGIIANTIVTGRISSQDGDVYFDLDANNGKGELAASVLKGVEEGLTTTARIGSGNWASGAPYQGLRVYYPGELTGSLVIALDGTHADYTQANYADISSIGDLDIRSNSHVDYSGGSNVLDFYGNSSTGEGTVILKRGTKNNTSKNVFYADADSLLIQYDGYNSGYIKLSDSSSSLQAGENKYLQFSDTFSSYKAGENQYLQFTDTSSIFRAGENQYLLFNDSSCVLFDKNKIEFGTNGYLRASIESNGDARFGDIYSNGTLVTSDRKKKSNVKKLSGSFLDKVKASPVYRYRLKREDIPHEAGNKTKRKLTTEKSESVGLMYDEAPEEIRRESENGEKAINLYSMVSVLWKAVQELSDTVDALKKEKEETA